MKRVGVKITRIWMGMVVLGVALASTAHASDEASASAGEQVGERLVVELSDPAVQRVRVEVFDDATGDEVYDSGLVRGRSVAIDLDAATATGAKHSVELRAWDAAGDLVLSQVSTLAGGPGQISAINFELIPPNTTLRGTSPITLDGDVAITGGLTLTGAPRFEGGRKICGGTGNNEWAWTVAGQDWTVSTCEDFIQAVFNGAAPTAYLGCITEDFFGWSGIPIQPPTPNCGW